MEILPAGGQARGWRAVLFQLGRERCVAPPLERALAWGVSRDGGGGRLLHDAARLHVRLQLRRAHAHVGALRAVLDQHAPVHGNSPCQLENSRPTLRVSGRWRSCERTAKRAHLSKSQRRVRMFTTAPVHGPAQRVNLQPSTFNPKPSTLNPQPLTINPKP